MWVHRRSVWNAIIASQVEPLNVPRVGREANIAKVRKARGAKGNAAFAAIVNAAAELLAEKGYEGLTVAGISASLGISAGAPYVYFANKEEIAA